MLRRPYQTYLKSLNSSKEMRHKRWRSCTPHYTRVLASYYLCYFLLKTTSLWDSLTSITWSCHSNVQASRIRHHTKPKTAGHLTGLHIRLAWPYSNISFSLSASGSPAHSLALLIKSAMVRLTGTAFHHHQPLCCTASNL